MINLQKRIPALVGLVALAALTACSASKSVMEPVDSMRGMKAATQQRLSTAAVDAIAAGKTEEALDLHAKLHKQHPKDRAIALAYAQLLRKTGKPAQAVKVLTPFASFKSRNNDSNPVTIYTSNAVILNELAAAHIATGNFAEAEKLLAHVLEDPSAAPLHADADSLMGIVMDARGDHRAAEQAFNRALAGWKGDPTPVMNTLTEVHMFATALQIQSETGSSLSEVLTNLSAVIRARFRLKRKIQALSSEAKASAGIIGSLPPLVCFGLWLASPNYMEPLLNTDKGHWYLVGCGMWMGCGILVMKQMINFRI